MDALRHILRLLWSPGALAESALRTPAIAALLAWTASGAIIVLCLGFALVAGSEGPYSDLADALRADLEAALRYTPLVALLAAVAGAVVLIGTSRDRDANRAGARAVLLSPVCVLLPIIAWTPLGAIVSVMHTNLYSDPAPWVHAPIIRILGAHWWLLGAALAYVWILRHAAARLYLLHAPGAQVCPACGYDLRGLDAGLACPECGRPRGNPLIPAPISSAPTSGPHSQAPPSARRSAPPPTPPM